MHIRTEGDKVLTQIATDVPRHHDVRTIVRKMLEVTIGKGGAGLAAPQVGILNRIIIINTKGFQCAIINPVITKWSGKTKDSRECCLSFPGITVKVKRDNKIVVEGFDENWMPVKKVCRAFTAFCVQHEIDHLSGRTIMDYDKDGNLKRER